MAEYNLEKQHSKGKLHAIERIDMLLDDGTFQEIELVKDRHYDGVIIGSGEISGKKVLRLLRSMVIFSIVIPRLLDLFHRFQLSWDHVPEVRYILQESQTLFLW